MKNRILDFACVLTPIIPTYHISQVLIDPLVSAWRNELSGLQLTGSRTPC